jgi:hypothetical protein
MIAPVVQGNIEVENIAIKKDPLIRDTVAYNLIRRCTQGLGKLVVIERRRV